MYALLKISVFSECLKAPTKHMETCPRRPAKPYVCERCSKCYTQRQQLLKHKAHTHNDYPAGHWETYQRTSPCAKCGKDIAAGYKNSKFNDHVRVCRVGEPCYPCPDCGKPFFPNLGNHKCRVNKVTGMQHKRTYFEKLVMVNDYRAHEAAGPEKLALYLEKVGRRGVTVKLQSSII